MKTPSPQLYLLLCECNYKRITDGADIDDLYEHKISSIQRNVQQLDPVTKKPNKIKYLLPHRKFRCPKCGKVLSPKKYPSTTAKETQEERQHEWETQINPDRIKKGSAGRGV